MNKNKKLKVLYSIWVRFFYIVYAMGCGFYYAITENIIFFFFGLFAFFVTFETDEKENKIKIKLERFK